MNTIKNGEGYLGRQITFLDTKTNEDTITVHEEILENAEMFITNVIEVSK